MEHTRVGVYLNAAELPVGDGCRVALADGDLIHVTKDGCNTASYTWHLGLPEPQSGNEATLATGVCDGALGRPSAPTRAAVHAEHPSSATEESVDSISQVRLRLERIGALTREEIELLMDPSPLPPFMKRRTSTPAFTCEMIAAAMVAVDIIRATNLPPPSAQTLQLYSLAYNACPCEKDERLWRKVALVFSACVLVAVDAIVGPIELDRDMSSAQPSLRAALPCRAGAVRLHAVSSGQLAQLGLAAHFLGKAFHYLGRWLDSLHMGIFSAPTSPYRAEPACTQDVWRAFLLGTYDRGSTACILRLAEVGLMKIFSECRLPPVRRFSLHGTFATELSGPSQFREDNPVFGNPAAAMTLAGCRIIRGQLGVPIEGLPAQHCEVQRLMADRLPASRTGVWLLTSAAPAPWESQGS
jgi:hypothetical protein